MSASVALTLSRSGAADGGVSAPWWAPSSLRSLRLPYVQRHDTPGEPPEPHGAKTALLQQICQFLGAGKTADARRQVGVGVAARQEAAEQRHDAVEPDAVEGRKQSARS